MRTYLRLTLTTTTGRVGVQTLGLAPNEAMTWSAPDDDSPADKALFEVMGLHAQPLPDPMDRYEISGNEWRRLGAEGRGPEGVWEIYAAGYTLEQAVDYAVENEDPPLELAQLTEAQEALRAMLHEFRPRSQRAQDVWSRAFRIANPSYRTEA